MNWVKDDYKLNIENHKGELAEINFPKILYHIIEEVDNRRRQALDSAIAITGGVGSGKSNIGHGIAGVFEHMNGRKFTLDQNFFSVDDVEKYTDLQETTGKAVDFDEAIEGGSSQDVSSKIGIRLKTMLIQKRFKRHLWEFILDNPKEYAGKILERASVLIHVKMIFDHESGIYYKGVFNICNQNELVDIADDLKKKRVRDVNSHPIIKKKTNYKIEDFSDIFFPRKDYNKKKLEDTKKISYRDEEREILVQRDKAIYYALFCGAKQRELGSFLGMSRTTVADAKARVLSTMESPIYDNKQRGKQKNY